MPENEETTYDAQRLVKELGEASDEELQAHFSGSDAAELVAWGATVATARINRDGWRILGQARDTLAQASEEQLDHLAAISTETLRLAAHAIARADALHAQQTARQQATSAGAAERQAAFEAIKASVIARRDVLFGVLRAVAADAEPYRGRITRAYSKAQDAESLADTLKALCNVGDDLLASTDAGIVQRRKTTRLRPQLLASVRTQAEQAATAAREQDKTNASPVTQAQVDLFDGYALALLDEVVGAFERGHHADPTIPRIALYTLRNVLRPPRGKEPQNKQPNG